LKGTVGEFIDSFDHAYTLWDQEPDEIKEMIKKISDRWVELPCSPSAESYSLLFLYVIDKILSATRFANGEKNVKVSSVRVHETATGYAEAFRTDLEWIKYKLKDIKFSNGVKDEWKDSSWFDKLLNHDGYFANSIFINSKPDYQIRITDLSIDKLKDFVEPETFDKKIEKNMDYIAFVVQQLDAKEQLKVANYLCPKEEPTNENIMASLLKLADNMSVVGLEDMISNIIREIHEAKN
jgi:6-pyruvoyl-tetrahydropterin synthase